MEERLSREAREHMGEAPENFMPPFPGEPRPLMPENLAREIAVAIKNEIDGATGTVLTDGEVDLTAGVIASMGIGDSGQLAERDAKARKLIRDFGWITCPTCSGRGFTEQHYDGQFNPPSQDACRGCNGRKTVLCEEAVELLALLGGGE